MEVSICKGGNVVMPQHIYKLFLILCQLGPMNIFNANININKHSFNLRKIRCVEMKCILERKENRSSLYAMLL